MEKRAMMDMRRHAVWHDPQQLKELRQVMDSYPLLSRKRELVVAYARVKGGLTLDFWKLFMGPWFEEPWVMTLEGCSQRLGVPVSDLRQICKETQAAIDPKLKGN
jgi:hypothetical protein